VAALLRHCLPDLMVPIGPPPVPRARPRIGFASALWTRGTVGAYFASWPGGLDRARFETFVYHLSPRQDQDSRRLAGECEHFIALDPRDGATLESTARRIRQDQLDVLIYPELGMSPELFPLAALRLAPVQCAGWGHPVTTGHRNIDYYLSSAPMEPPNGPDHY